MQTFLLSVALILIPTVSFAQQAGGATPPPIAPTHENVEAHNSLVNQYQVANDAGDALSAQQEVVFRSIQCSQVAMACGLYGESIG